MLEQNKHDRFILKWTVGGIVGALGLHTTSRQPSKGQPVRHDYYLLQATVLTVSRAALHRPVLSIILAHQSREYTSYTDKSVSYYNLLVTICRAPNFSKGVSSTDGSRGGNIPKRLVRDVYTILNGSCMHRQLLARRFQGVIGAGLTFRLPCSPTSLLKSPSFSRSHTRGGPGRVPKIGEKRKTNSRRMK